MRAEEVEASKIMFCPVCKYEFRRGFTHCNTCDMDLVDALPSEEVDHKLRTPADEMDSPTLLWKGASGGTFSAITAALDAAKIAYNREDLDARLVFSSEFSDLEIWVPAADFSDAQAVLDDVNNSTAPLPAELPDATNELLAEDDEAADDIRHETLKELYAEDATAEVWSGNAASNAANSGTNNVASNAAFKAANNDAAMAEILKSCLAEIGVPCYVERPDAGSGDAQPVYAVRVLPEDEERAKEIVRQVIDAAPPA
ncbi:MAG: putative signal transducing protein [Candidatus Acidiferrales bacterium]